MTGARKSECKSMYVVDRERQPEPVTDDRHSQDTQPILTILLPPAFVGSFAGSLFGGVAGLVSLASLVVVVPLLLLTVSVRVEDSVLAATIRSRLRGRVSSYYSTAHDVRGVAGSLADKYVEV